MTDRRFIPPHERRRPLPPARAMVSGETGKTDSGRTPYQLGRAFEASIRGRLERRGYFVRRSHMSKGQPDLLATGPVTAARGISGLYIQAKRRGQIGVKEWNELFHLARKYQGWPVVTMKLSERTVGFYRLDESRKARSPQKSWSLFDPADLSEMTPPPSLLDKAV